MRFTKKQFQQFLSAVKLLLREYRPYRKWVGILILAMVFKTVFETLLSVLLLPLLDELQESTSTPAALNQMVVFFHTYSGVQSRITLVFILLILAAFAKGMMTLVFYFFSALIQSSFENDKRENLFSGFLHSKWMFFINQKTGHVINTIFGETTRASHFFTSSILLIDTVVLIFFYIATAAYISPTAMSVALIIFLLIGVSILPIMKKSKQYADILKDAREGLMHHLTELLNAFKVVKGCRMEDVGRKFVSRQSRRYRRYMIRYGILKHLPGSILDPLVILSVGLIFFILYYYQLAVFSEAAVIVVILYRCFQKITSLQQFWISIFEFIPSVSLIANLPAILEKNRESQSPGLVETFERMEMQELTVVYPNAKQPALNRINLSIERGDFVGIVGSSGAGKTTFVDIILDLLQPTSGEFLVNGISLPQINLFHWRDLIGYVPQESILFNDSIFNNIALYRQEVQEEDVYWAAQVADAEEFIQDLPHGYETYVGDRGTKLSGGQRQRLALARAIAHKPQILLLDEATSSLDTFSEKKIQKAIEALRGHMTIIVVAHRLSTVLEADRIIVLDKGRIDEDGSPMDLLGQSGKFQEMYSLQTNYGSI
ncbi:MAG: ABC transporter ATP-binding protein [Candidatus Omnitrophota bacterium]|jgi:ABC-type multidrug transport system fused ATPase/permease subunit|nr:MAG: ABC transporter ATP-binding protein [Candidatus Omnitrophota bacterium]